MSEFKYIYFDFYSINASEHPECPYFRRTDFDPNDPFELRKTHHKRLLAKTYSERDRVENGAENFKTSIHSNKASQGFSGSDETDKFYDEYLGPRKSQSVIGIIDTIMKECGVVDLTKLSEIVTSPLPFDIGNILAMKMESDEVRDQGMERKSMTSNSTSSSKESQLSESIQIPDNMKTVSQQVPERTTKEQLTFINLLDDRSILSKKSKIEETYDQAKEKRSIATSSISSSRQPPGNVPVQTRVTPSISLGKESTLPKKTKRDKIHDLTIERKCIATSSTSSSKQLPRIVLVPGNVKNIRKKVPRLEGLKLPEGTVSTKVSFPLPVSTMPKKRKIDEIQNQAKESKCIASSSTSSTTQLYRIGKIPENVRTVPKQVPGIEGSKLIRIVPAHVNEPRLPSGGLPYMPVVGTKVNEPRLPSRGLPYMSVVGTKVNEPRLPSGGLLYMPVVGTQFVIPRLQLRLPSERLGGPHFSGSNRQPENCVIYKICKKGNIVQLVPQTNEGGSFPQESQQSGFNQVQGNVKNIDNTVKREETGGLRNTPVVGTKVVVPILQLETFQNPQSSLQDDKPSEKPKASKDSADDFIKSLVSKFGNLHQEKQKLIRDSYTEDKMKLMSTGVSKTENVMKQSTNSDYKTEKIIKQTTGGDSKAENTMKLSSSSDCLKTRDDVLQLKYPGKKPLCGAANEWMQKFETLKDKREDEKNMKSRIASQNQESGQSSGSQIQENVTNYQPTNSDSKINVMMEPSTSSDSKIDVIIEPSISDHSKMDVMMETATSSYSKTEDAIKPLTSSHHATGDVMKQPTNRDSITTEDSTSNDSTTTETTSSDSYATEESTSSDSTSTEGSTSKDYLKTSYKVPELEYPVKKPLCGLDKFEKDEREDEKYTKSRITEGTSLEPVTVQQKALEIVPRHRPKQKESMLKSVCRMIEEDRRVYNRYLEEQERKKDTDYYLTPNTTTMRVVRKFTSNDSKIFKCRVEGFTCNFCGSEFRSRKELLEHKRQYINFVPSGAYICSRFSKRYCMVIIGYDYFKHRIIQFKCSHCQRKFRSVGGYSRHCNVCKKDRSYLVSPFVKKCLLDNDEWGFECFLCQESSTIYSEIKFHECIISRDLPENCYEKPSTKDLPENCYEKPPKAETYPCNKCDKVFKESGDLDTHDGEEHSETFKCAECDIEFYDANSYTSHRREHVLGERYECKICLKSYSRVCSLKKHMDYHKAKISEKTT